MNNPVKSAVVALLLCCAVVAPIASAWGNGAMSKPARFPSAPVAAQAVVVAPMTIAAVTTIPEITVVGRVQRVTAARKPAVVAATSTLCRARELDQGGRPGAETVLSCE